MIRKNDERTGPRSNSADEIPADLKQMLNPMDFVAPTDFVELPSKGLCYPEGHPLHGQDTIEIKFMTAKEEDILSSRTLLKKGVAIDRLISSLIKDKTIDPRSLVVGDRNAILIKARGSAYGIWYKTKVNCSACGEQNSKAFNLEQPHIYCGDQWEDYEIKQNEKGLYDITLPYSSVIIECKLLNGNDELNTIKTIQKNNKKEGSDGLVVEQMRQFIVSVNGYGEKNVIDYFINNMVAPDSRYLRKAVKCITPDVKIKGELECSSCGHEQELEVPFGADFLWPDGGV